MYKVYFNRTAFIKARIVLSVEHQAGNIKVVGSSPTVGRSTGPIQMKSSLTFIRGNRCVERLII